MLLHATGIESRFLAALFRDSIAYLKINLESITSALLLPSSASAPDTQPRLLSNHLVITIFFDYFTCFTVVVQVNWAFGHPVIHYVYFRLHTAGRVACDAIISL